MKSIFIIAITLLCSSFAVAQTTLNVPEVVKSKFASLYPGIKAEWEMEDEMYEASFVKGELETAVLISPAGDLIETENQLLPNTLPRMVRYYVASQLDNKPISSGSKITSYKGVVTYEAEVEGNDYLFDAEGNFIGIETDDEEEED
jgi:hypothetical protein